MKSKIQNKLCADIREYKKCQKKMTKMNKKIDREARELLRELQEIKGWECMILECACHYVRYPEKFFDWCSVEISSDAVEFYKRYTCDENCKVMSINIRKSLAEQVNERLKYLAKYNL